MAFAGGAHPAAVCLDLAIQGAGSVSVPLELRPGEGPAAQLAALSCRAWAEPEGSFSPGALPPGIQRVALPAWVPAGRALEAERPPAPQDDKDSRDSKDFSKGDGGVVCQRDGVPLELSGEDLAAWAGRIGERLGPAEREILILGGSLAGWAERGMLAWATTVGAVVLLEGDPETRIASAAWARVTLFHGTARELGQLKKVAEEVRRGRWKDWLLGGKGRPRLPFGRLRTLVLAGPEPLLQEDQGFWEERGVRILDLPPWYINGERGERDA